MKIITDIFTKLKLLLADLRRNLGLLLIIGVIWVLLLIGILFLKVYIGPMSADDDLINYFPQAFIEFVTSVVKVAIAGVYVLIWLYLWNRSVRTYFWRTIKKYYGLSDETNNGAPE
ncbi:MAG: hypothetical protein LUQ65_01770 [Candidatus Helarchaeota archaeon]|nr:hypothetical protein [Candidatus Helarchaeota archaeon]